MLREHLEETQRSQTETLEPKNGEQRTDAQSNESQRLQNQKQSQERDKTIHMWTFTRVYEPVDAVDTQERELVAHFDVFGCRAGANLVSEDSDSGIRHIWAQEIFLHSPQDVFRHG